MTPPSKTTRTSLLFEVLKNIASCECQLLNNEDSLEKVTFADGAVGIVFIDDNISEFILKLRISPELRDTAGRLPLIFLGFRSLRSVLITERFPKLLSSQGIFYLKLPADVAEITKVFNTAKLTKIESPVETVRFLIETSDDLSREQSKIIHTMGNFFGSEKLLYGAYLSHRISANKLKDIIRTTRSIQREYCNEDSFNYDLHIVNQPNYETMPEIITENSLGSGGKILFIDDLADLGWAQAAAQVLSGEQQIIITSVTSEEGLIIQKHSSQDGKLYLESLSKDPSKEISETTFLSKLSNKLDEAYVNSFDIILLDLRLKKSIDENLSDPTTASGTEVLRKLRKINAGIPIIILTASRMAKNMNKVFNLGADDYFLKEMKITNDEDAKDFYGRFFDTINFALSKSYLGPAWQVIQWIKNNYISQKTEDKDEHIRLLKKAVVFLRKKSYDFERNEMGYDTIGNAVVELDKIKETKEKIRIISNSLDGGMLIQGLRNIEAHAGVIQLSEFDAKVALYLTFRLFLSNEQILESFVIKAFNNRSYIDIKTIFCETYAKLAVVLHKPYLETITVPYGQLLSQDKNAALNPNFYTRYCVKESTDKKIDYLYLFFLSRIPLQTRDRNKYLQYDKYTDVDNIFLSRLFERISQLGKVNVRLQGIINAKSKSGWTYKIVSDEFLEDIVCPINLDSGLRKKLEVGDTAVTFNVSRTGEKEYYALNIMLATD